MPWYFSKWENKNIWINDMGRKRCLVSTALTLVFNFYKAKELRNYSDDLCAKYAILSGERSWHGPGRLFISLDGKRWKENKRIDTSVDRFLKLINSPFGTEVGIKEIESLEMPEACFALISGNPYIQRDMKNKEIFSQLFYKGLKIKDRRKRELEKAYQNHHIIVGEDHELKPGIFFHFLSDPSKRREWLPFKRGRDLFIFGKFNIGGIADAFDPKFLPISPFNIMAMGYGGSAHHINLIFREDIIREYIKRYKSFFLRDQNMARIDELYYAQVNMGAFLYEEIRKNIRPNTLLRRIEERRERRMKTFPNPDFGKEWDWVREAFPPKETELGRLIPIDNYDQLSEVATEMNNCARMYGRNIDNKDSLLVFLEKEGEKKALCQYLPDGGIAQCFGPSNEQLNNKVRELFKENSIEWR